MYVFVLNLHLPHFLTYSLAYLFTYSVTYYGFYDGLVERRKVFWVGRQQSRIFFERRGLLV